MTTLEKTIRFVSLLLIFVGFGVRWMHAVEPAAGYSLTLAGFGLNLFAHLSYTHRLRQENAALRQQLQQTAP